jgi:hypothetical protein
MNRTIMNYLIDMLMLASALLCTLTGIIKWPDLLRTLGVSSQSLPMELVSAVHDGSGLVVVLLAIVHIAMHRKWLALMTRSYILRRCD